MHKHFPVCRALVSDINISIRSVGTRKVQVGSFRVDSKGNQDLRDVSVWFVLLLHSKVYDRKIVKKSLLCGELLLALLKDRAFRPKVSQ